MYRALEYEKNIESLQDDLNHVEFLIKKLEVQNNVVKNKTYEAECAKKAFQELCNRNQTELMNADQARNRVIENLNNETEYNQEIVSITSKISSYEEKHYKKNLELDEFIKETQTIKNEFSEKSAKLHSTEKIVSELKKNSEKIDLDIEVQLKKLKTLENSFDALKESLKSIEENLNTDHKLLSKLDSDSIQDTNIPGPPDTEEDQDIIQEIQELKKIMKLNLEKLNKTIDSNTASNESQQQLSEKVVHLVSQVPLSQDTKYQKRTLENQLMRLKHESNVLVDKNIRLELQIQQKIIQSSTKNQIHAILIGFAIGFVITLLFVCLKKLVY
jgi:hypothetical protein